MSLMLRDDSPTSQQVADRLLQVARAEGLATDKPAMEKLAESTHADIRQALHMLQLWNTRTRALSFYDVKVRVCGRSFLCL